MEKQQEQAVDDTDDADMGGRLEKGAFLRKKGKALGKQPAGPQGDSQAEYGFQGSAGTLLVEKESARLKDRRCRKASRSSPANIPQRSAWMPYRGIPQ